MSVAERDALATITAVRDRCAQAGNMQMVAALQLAMFEISSLRQELTLARARYRLVEQMVSEGLPGQ